MVKVTSWGRLTHDEHNIVALNRDLSLQQVQLTSQGLAYGMGRSYGDVCLNPNGNLWLTKDLDHFISFDNSTGRLVCESGVLLRDIQQTLIHQGWLLSVTPGTQIVTVGGAIANDVHGKNHHVLGSFGDHVLRIRLLRTNGEIIDCGPTQNADWFKATIGGLGLTGVIIEVELQLKRVPGPWLDTQTIPYSNLDDFFCLADESEQDWDQTVSWIDCVAGDDGRGIFMRANPLDAGQKKLPKTKQISIPIIPPVSLVNKLSLPPFNKLYYFQQKRKSGRAVVHYEPFSYPLDSIQHWNRMYGPKGFYQYQSVVPRDNAKYAIKAMLKAIAKADQGSFLAVLKTFGNRHSLGMLSFPMPGVTLALDFPNKGDSTLKLFEALDSIVREVRGRLYMAKDSRMPKDLFESGYPQVQEFLKYRDAGISSAMSRRLMGS